MRVGILGHHSGLAQQLAKAGVEPVACAEIDDVPNGVASIARLEGYFDALEHPRRFLLDLPAGPEVDQVVDRCYVVMEPGDVVLDPTPSYWGDTLRRFRRMRHRSLYYVDCALIEEPRTALAAGDERGVELARAVLDLMVPPGRVVHAGGAGAAHYAVMVRAGVVTAAAHALSEARQMLEAYPNEAEAEAVMARLWPIVEPAAASAAWLLDDAVRLRAVIPLLTQGVMLELAAALDEHRAAEVPPRVGGFVHPDDIL